MTKEHEEMRNIHEIQESIIEEILGEPWSGSQLDMAEYLATRAAIATRILAKTIVMTKLREDKPKMEEFFELFINNTRQEVEDTWQAFQEWKKTHKDQPEP